MEPLEPGSAAPPFELKSLNGKTISLADLRRERPVFLVFMKVSCPVCQMTFPFLDRLSRGGVSIVSVSQDHAGATQSFNAKFGVSFATLLDEETAGYPVSNAYGVNHVPTGFLVEPDGEVSMVMEGFAKRQLEEVGARAGVAPFAASEYVPEWKAG